MKISTHKQIILCIISIFLFTLLISGCANNKSIPDYSKPPQIPPESSFVMDFSNFTNQQEALFQDRQTARLVSFRLSEPITQSDASNALGDRSNWGFAAFNVGFWNIVGVLGLAVPVASFVESFKHTPTPQPDASWIWTYDVPVAGVTYTAALHGKYIDKGVRWEMYITKQGEFLDFLRYYGESDLPETEGFWVLKNTPAIPTDLIRIDWHRNPSNNTGDIKYTNVVPGGSENGGFISFAMTTSNSFDRAYEIYNKGKNETTNIEWNSITKEGRVKDTLHFGDTNWRCWNSQLINSECQ